MLTKGFGFFCCLWFHSGLDFFFSFLEKVKIIKNNGRGKEKEKKSRVDAMPFLTYIWLTLIAKWSQNSFSEQVIHGGSFKKINMYFWSEKLNLLWQEPKASRSLKYYIYLYWNGTSFQDKEYPKLSNRFLSLKQVCIWINTRKNIFIRDISESVQ